MKTLRETTGTEQDCGSSVRELSLHLHLKGCEEGKMTATQKATGGACLLTATGREPRSYAGNGSGGSCWCLASHKQDAARVMLWSSQAWAEKGGQLSPCF